MGNYEKISRELVLKREELRFRIDKINKDYAKPLDRDSSEQAVELGNAEVVGVIHREAMIELEQINKTLDLIDQDEYGNCVTCGMPIPVRRLEIIPYTNFCVPCAEKNTQLK